MFRSAALCVALVLGLSACKQADAKDFAELYAATDVAFAKCEQEAGTLTSQIDWDQLNRADQYCSMAIAGDRPSFRSTSGLSINCKNCRA